MMFWKKKKAVLKSRSITPDQTKSIRVVEGSRASTQDEYMAKLTPEAQADLKKQDEHLNKLRDFAENNPEELGELLKIWLSMEE